MEEYVEYNNTENLVEYSIFFGHLSPAQRQVALYSLMPMGG